MFKKTSFIWPLLTFVVIPIAGNAAAVAFLIEFITPLAYTQDVISQIRRAAPTYGLALDLAPFVVVTALTFMSSLPVYRQWLANEDKSRMDDQAKRKLVNAPIVLATLTFVGWLTALLLGYFSVWYLEVHADLWWYIFNALLVVFNGALAFMVIYYALDFLNRHLYIDLLFPDGNLYELPGLMHVSIQSRFLILYLSVGLLPTLILSASLYIALTNMNSSETHHVFVIFCTFFVLSILLTFLFARSLYEPVQDIRHAAGRIRDGDFSPHVPVRTSDEIGDLSVGFNAMVAGLREREKIRQDFGRAVDPRVRDYLLEHADEMGGEERIATVLFSDIRGFTSLSENREPRQVVEILNRYFEQMNIAIENNHGVVNKFIGDAVMGLFGVPMADENHAEHAVRAGLEMLRLREELNVALTRDGLPALRTGIGIHTGPLLAGNLGSKRRMEYTVIGDSVNLSSRLESLCKKVQREYLISGATHAALPGDLADAFPYLARVKVKGKETAVPVHAYRAP